MKITAMKKILILFIGICFNGLLNAQQLPQITQYMMNNYAINPAVSSMYDYYQINSTIRNQWTIEGAPRTTVLTMYGKKNEHVGLGGMVFNDEAGSESRIGASASYAYSFSATKNIRMSFALSAGFQQYKLCKTCLEGESSQDLLLNGDVIRSIPDAIFGFNMYSDKWYVGFSVPQLLTSKIELYSDAVKNAFNTDSIPGNDVEGNGVFSRHYYALGAYNLALNSSWTLQPSLLFKSTSGSSQVDIGLKTDYNNTLWWGMSYKVNNDLSPLSALFGYTINQRYTIGYSYDLPTTDKSGIPGPTHEFLLGIRFIPSSESDITR